MAKQPKRPCPPDFQEKRLELGSMTKLAAHYSAAHRTIARWLSESGLPRMKGLNPPSRKIAIPDDFASCAHQFLLKELAQKFGVSVNTITRWVKETGVRTKPPHGMQLPSLTARIPGAKRDTIYDIAADCIRRHMPVYKSDEKGSYSAKGKFYRVGMSVLTKQGLLEKAEYYKRKEERN